MQPKVIRYDTVHSTNTIAWELAEKGCEDATVVLAARQDGGRGRLTRCFQSPPGGLYMSVVLRPDLPPASRSLITIAAGLACADAIRRCCAIDVALKWPNDMYLADRKVGGILSESSPYFSSESHRSFVVVGIGINVNTPLDSFSPELRDTVTSLYDAEKSEYDIEALLREILRQLYGVLPLLAGEQHKVFARWRARDYLLERMIRWRNPQGDILTGYGAGLLEDGQYLIRTADGCEHPILAGDILIPMEIHE